jgi:leucyl-tRNA synthetase
MLEEELLVPMELALELDMEDTEVSLELDMVQELLLDMVLALVPVLPHCPHVLLSQAAGETNATHCS